MSRTTLSVAASVLSFFVLSPAARGDTLVVRPRLETCWTGRANVNGGKWSGNLAIITNPDFRAWAMFDLALVPDSSRVTAASLHYVNFPGRDSAFSLWRHLSSDPLTASGPVLYAECGSAPVASDTAYEPVSGEAIRMLNDAGLAAIQAGLTSDRVVFGWQRYNSLGWRYARGIETPGQEPYLVVAFVPPVGVGEIAQGGWRRANVPTIVRGSLNLQSSISNRQSAELLDASGRKVLELQTGANDVRRLSPGVYFVRGEGSRARGAEGSRVTKVVVTR